MAKKGTVLICLSGAHHIQLKSGKEEETGFFLKELGGPLIKLLDAGYDVEFATPSGGPANLDPLSDSSVWFIPRLAEKEREKELLRKMEVEKNLGAPLRFSSIKDSDLDKYVGVLLPGGHAPMMDLPDDKSLGRILLHFHRKQQPTALICHAPVALLSTRQAAPDAVWAYKGYKMTCYSNLEEKTNELLWRDSLAKKAEDMLRKAGAEMCEAPPLVPRVTRHRELITAQGPTSVDAFGSAFVAALEGDEAHKFE